MLDPERWVTEGVDTSREPHYTISELAKFFFNRSPAWVRWRERKGCFILDAIYDKKGKEYVPTKTSIHFGVRRTDEGARYYTLADVEGIAHALCQKGDINATQRDLALFAVAVEARIFGYI
jgi:hypothetical protein